MDPIDKVMCSILVLCAAGLITVYAYEHYQRVAAMKKKLPYWNVQCKCRSDLFGIRCCHDNPLLKGGSCIEHPAEYSRWTQVRKTNGWTGGDRNGTEAVKPDDNPYMASVQWQEFGKWRDNPLFCRDFFGEQRQKMYESYMTDEQWKAAMNFNMSGISVYQRPAHEIPEPTLDPV